jgi:hypothetical protein
VKFLTGGKERKLRVREPQGRTGQIPVPTVLSKTRIVSVDKESPDERNKIRFMDPCILEPWEIPGAFFA